MPKVPKVPKMSKIKDVNHSIKKIRFQDNSKLICQGFVLGSPSSLTPDPPQAENLQFLAIRPERSASGFDRTEPIRAAMSYSYV
jgi:hypothetical protein